ncbi:glycosyltransferase family 4 protein [Imperialibacter roseus]|uniref:Glycosyltransferase family 4 protein n=1 Tax=Imperialibacter roseus TaxID=1324217 RepID=A0ABZ0ILJ7_9BACT|nr:glycosyltransferase family 4 protein [Imperialibacter roseus]WOK05364.1 glycosyltransferase family 4 protein [Imperialibacter roseus]
MSKTSPNKDIVFINQSVGYLMIDIIHAFSKDYERIILITGEVIQRNRPLPPNVVIRKVAKYKRSSTIMRFWSWTQSFLKSCWYLLHYSRKAPVFAVSNPPFNVFLSLIFRNKFTYLIYDIYPEAFVEFNYLKKDSFLVRIWQWMNKRSFERATGIFTLTQGMKEVLEKYTEDDKIKVVPIWTDNDFLKPVEKNANPFIEQHDWHNKFIVLYSGNLGKSHPIDDLMKAAQLTTVESILFVIIGDGERKEYLEDLILSHSLTNCQLLPWQAVDVLPYSLGSADIAIVVQGKDASKLAIPSKTYNYLSVGAPIIGIASEDSELCKLIEENNVGYCFTGGDASGLSNFILSLYQDPELRMEISARCLELSKLYSPSNANNFVKYAI